MLVPWPKSPEHDDFLTNFNENWCIVTSRLPAGPTVHTKEKTVDTRRHNGSGRPTQVLTLAPRLGIGRLVKTTAKVFSQRRLSELVKT